jgi:transposase
MRFRNKSWKNVHEKNAHEKLLEYFKSRFPQWIKANPSGIFGFFGSDLDRLTNEGYLEKEEHVETISDERQIETNYYRLSMKGFSELAELKTKKWNRISVIISIFALIISILTFIFSRRALP